MSTRPEPRTYGYHYKTPEDPARCVEAVYDHYSSRQCTRKRGHGPDGLYCKMHDPVARQAKVAARNAEWAAKYKANRDRAEALANKEKRYLRALQMISNGHNDPRRVAQAALDQTGPDIELED